MRSFEMSGDVPVTRQPIREPEMRMPMSPIMQSILEQRMALAALFRQPIMMSKRNPFALPQLPEEVRPKFDVGGGGPR